jgi:hypothetical protein
MTKMSTIKEKILWPSTDPVKLDQSLVQFERVQVKLPSRSEKLLCHLLKIHTGKWVYTRESSCHQLKVCRRCGNTKVRIKHQREWQYITRVPRKKPKIDQSICSQCGMKFPGFFSLEWHLERKHEINPDGIKPLSHIDCEQERVCGRCGEIWPGHRTRHVWSSTYSTGSNTSAHACLRCGWVEKWDTSYND